MNLALGILPFLIVIVLALSREITSTFYNMVHSSSRDALWFLMNVLWVVAVAITLVTLGFAYAVIVFAPN